MGKDGARFVNKEVYERINFLYQAAHFCLTQSPDNTQQCRFYISTLRTVAEKHVIRLHPDIKRSICKKCFILLIPGLTAIYRNKKKGEKYTVETCLECGNIKRYLLRKNYTLWIDNKMAWIPS